MLNDEAALLTAVSEFVEDSFDTDRHYLTAYNGGTWSGGFDLPFCRSAVIRHDMEWPFGGDVAYVNVFEMVDHFDTNGQQDLAGVYDHLVGDQTPDPFDDSAAAVDAFKQSRWKPLLAHNLALLAEQFVPKSDFAMKSLQPPE